MVVTPPKRPDSAIDKIIEALRPLGEVIHIPARKRIGWRSRDSACLYLFVRGEISVLRISDGLVLSSTFEPHVFGLSEIISPMHCNLLRAETDSTLIRVDADCALAEIERQGIWDAVAEVSIYHTNMMVFRDLKIVNQRTPPVVQNYLQELDALPEEKKYQVNILNYVQERTGLSRSSILNVITSLKKNKCIDYERGGYQLRINNLPE